MTTESAPGPDRLRPGAEARRVVEAAHDLARRTTTFLARPDVLREQARRQLDDLKAGQVEARLRELPLGAIKEVTGRGVRLAALEGAEVRTVADVVRAGRTSCRPCRAWGGTPRSRWCRPLARPR